MMLQMLQQQQQNVMAARTLTAPAPAPASAIPAAAVPLSDASASLCFMLYLLFLLLTSVLGNALMKRTRHVLKSSNSNLVTVLIFWALTNGKRMQGLLNFRGHVSKGRISNS
jgi:hypothetical protein